MATGESRPFLASLLDRYVALCSRRAGTVLLVALGVAGLAIVCASRVVVDTRIESLLPGESASTRALAELRGRTSTDAPLYLLVQSGDPALNRALATKVRDEVARWPDTEWAIDRRDPSFFLDRRLLYLPAQELEALADRAEQIVEFEECAALPGCVNLEPRPDTPSEAEVARLLHRVPEVGTLAGLFGASSLDEAAWPYATRSGPLPHGNAPGQLCATDGTVCAAQAVLRGDPLDLAYARSVTNRAQALFRRLRPSDAPADLRLELSGRYRDAPETHRVVTSDLAKTSLLSTALILGCLWPLFRGFRSLLVLTVPLVFSAALTLGGLGLFHPRLNLISAFTLAVLAGVGVDFGIHFLSHYGLHHGTASPGQDALALTVRRLVGPMTMAAVTTAAGFLALYPASFRGFSEMGAVCAAGIGVTFVSTLLLAPAVLSWCSRGSGAGREFVRALPALDTRVPPKRFVRSVVLLGLVLAAALGVLGAERLEFERDFRRLRPETTERRIPGGRALHGTERNSVFLVADSAEALQRAAATLRAEGAKQLVRGDRPWLVTPGTFVPADQAPRLAAIARLRTAAERAEKLGNTDPEFDRLKRWVSVDRPIVPGDLPVWVRGWFVERDGRFGRLGVLFTDLSGSSVDQMQTLSEALDGYRARFGEVHFASGVALLGEVVPALARDAPVILGLATLGLTLAILAVRRSFRWLWLTLVPLLLSAALAIGVLALFDVRINFYNLLVFPLAVGLGIDGSIYVTEALLEPHTPRDFATATRAVLGATVTTVAGFAALLVAKNPGLVSLAQVAIVTMGATLLVNLVWLPRWLALARVPVAAERIKRS